MNAVKSRRRAGEEYTQLVEGLVCGICISDGFEGHFLQWEEKRRCYTLHRESRDLHGNNLIDGILGDIDKK